MKPLRVLHVLGQLNPSGAETMLRTAAPHFIAAGVELTVLSTGFERGPFAPALEAAGCEVRHLPFVRTPNHFWQVFQLMRQPRFDAVHMHTERGNFYYGLGALAARKPAVRTVHAVFGFEGSLRWRRALQRRMLQALGVRHVAIGKSVLNNERERFGMQLLQVNNWYDESRFTPATPEQKSAARRALGIATDRPVIASVGNCSELKNHKSLLRALAMLPAEKRPLYLHAGTEDADRSERTLCAELGLDKVRDVQFLGAISNIDQLLAASDVFVMPSLREGLGIAALEALGAGVPALLTDVPGLRDFAPDFTGLVYCSPEPDALARGLLQCIQTTTSPNAADEARQRCHVAKRLYGIERGVRAYIELYR